MNKAMKTLKKQIEEKFSAEEIVNEILPDFGTVDHDEWLRFVELIKSHDRQHAIEFELFLMKEREDISSNPKSVEHAYDNWKKLTS